MLTGAPPSTRDSCATSGVLEGQRFGEPRVAERHERLARTAAERLARDGYENVHVRHGDGTLGWPEAAPFDAIVVTAAPPRIPKPLEEQLASGGRLVIPVGEDMQELRVLTRGPAGLSSRSIFPVRFVPMTGEAQRK